MVVSTALLLGALLVLLRARTSSASALTTTVPANERACFYANVDKAGEKVRSPRERVRAPKDTTDSVRPPDWLLLCCPVWRLVRH